MFAAWRTRFTVNYNANGGHGTMTNTTVTHGVSTSLRRNAFTHPQGHNFAGWHARRTDAQGRFEWRYINGSGQAQWIRQGAAVPAGFARSLYRDGGNVSTTTPLHNGQVTMFAQWAPSRFIVSYNANGGRGTMTNTTVHFGINTPLRHNTFTRTSYDFAGWHMRRTLANGTHQWRYTNGNTNQWISEGETAPAGFARRLHSNAMVISSTTSINNGQVTMFAQWAVPRRSFQEMNSNLTFTPWWSRVENSGFAGGVAMRTDRAGQELTFRFRGTAIEFLVQQGASHGSFDVYINGQRRHRVNTHSATTRNQQAVGRVTGLSPDQNHTVRIVSRATSGRTRVVIDRIDVTGPAPSISAWPARTAPSINRSNQSPNWGGAFNGVRWIVLHHTASNNTNGEISWLTNPRSQVSYNYLIAKDGRIFELVPPGRRAWHAGAGPGAPWGIANNNMNAWSVGISMTNLGNGRDPFPEAQLRSLENLIRHLRGTYGHVPIIDHKMWAPGRKNDLAMNFPFARFGFSSPMPRSGLSLDLMSSLGIEWIDQNGAGGETGYENWILVEPEWSDNDFYIDIDFDDGDDDSSPIEILSLRELMRPEDVEDTECDGDIKEREGSE